MYDSLIAVGFVIADALLNTQREKISLPLQKATIFYSPAETQRR